MSAPTYWIEATPQVEHRDGVLVATFTSGEQSFSFAMSMKACSILCSRAGRAVDELVEHRAEVVPLCRARQARRQKK